MRVLYSVVADFYRLMAALLDWRCHIRKLLGRPGFDVLCVTNFEDSLQQNFIGLNKNRMFAYGLRFSIKGKLVRFGLINSTSRDLDKKNGEAYFKAKENFEAILVDASKKAKGRKMIVLLAASLKRLHSEEEMEALKNKFPNLLFTKGDNGTALCLGEDILEAIKDNGVGYYSKIMITGPNGYLGGHAKEILAVMGFHNLVLVSTGAANPFEGISDVELVVACSHMKKVRLTPQVLKQIAQNGKIAVVDVCRPPAMTKKSFFQIGDGLEVDRRDAGNTCNKNIKYVFRLGAIFVLKDLMLSTERLYGCFSEAAAIPFLEPSEIEGLDLLSVNERAMKIALKAFVLSGFRTSFPCNFGKKKPKKQEEVMDRSVKKLIPSHRYFL